MIKALRQRTSAGIMDCKRALEEAEGDEQKATELLKKKGLAVASQKSGRETGEGLVEAYIHGGGRVGAMVELSCETDFVARTDELKGLAHDLAMQVAAMSPLYVARDDMDGDESRPPEVVCLLDQPYIKDSSRTVRDVVEQLVAQLRENIQVRRFSRFALGE